MGDPTDIDGHDCDCLLTEFEKVKECTRYTASGREHHDITLSGGISVIHHQLLQEWRDAGFEVFAFGRNRRDIDNLTANMVREGSDE